MADNFSNSESLCRSDASHQVLVQSMVWEAMSFEEFHGSHLKYLNGMILAVLNLYVATIPPTKFQLNPTYGSGGMSKM